MKWSTYLFCLVLISLGLFCGVRWTQEVRAKSYVNGSIKVSNEFSRESFEYSNTFVAFTSDIPSGEGSYSFDKDLLKVDDFNGNTKKYEVVLNDFVLLNAQIKAGSVFIPLDMDFYDTDGDPKCSGTLDILVEFLSGKTHLSMRVKNKEQASFFEQYFKDNGIRLKIIEIR